MVSTVEDRELQFGRVSVGEGVLPRQHVVESDSDAPDVHLLVVLLGDHLRGLVHHWAHLVSHGQVPMVRLRQLEDHLHLGLGLAWASELDSLLEADQLRLDVLLAIRLGELYHYVLRPDVPVSDVSRVQIRY